MTTNIKPLEGSQLTVGDLIRDFTDRLKKAEVYAPFQDAQALLAHAMGLDFEVEFSLPWDTPVDSATAQKADELVQRREAREPLTRILGTADFWGLNFQIEDCVFRPDPHAEALVDNALIILEKKKNEKLRLLDLGTGSGCLLLALLHSLPNSTGVGVDIDIRSVNAATRNAEQLDLQNRASFIQSSWGEKIEEKFDFIISNPPAVLTQDVERLDPEMREYETKESLMGGEDGLDALREIVKDLDRLLKPTGTALIRAHTWEREAEFFKNAGYTNVEVRGNYRQNPWCVILRADKKASTANLLKRIFSINPSYKS